MPFLSRVIDTIVGLVTTILTLRLVIVFFGANPNAGFVQWIYAGTAQLMGPFAGIFPMWSLGGGYVLDVSVVIAMIAYGILGWAIVRVLALFVLPVPVTNREM